MVVSPRNNGTRRAPCRDDSHRWRRGRGAAAARSGTRGHAIDDDLRGGCPVRTTQSMSSSKMTLSFVPRGPAKSARKKRLRPRKNGGMRVEPGRRGEVSRVSPSITGSGGLCCPPPRSAQSLPGQPPPVTPASCEDHAVGGDVELPRRRVHDAEDDIRKHSLVLRAEVAVRLARMRATNAW